MAKWRRAFWGETMDGVECRMKGHYVSTRGNKAPSTNIQAPEKSQSPNFKNGAVRVVPTCLRRITCDQMARSVWSAFRLAGAFEHPTALESGSKLRALQTL